MALPHPLPPTSKTIGGDDTYTGKPLTDPALRAGLLLLRWLLIAAVGALAVVAPSASLAGVSRTALVLVFAAYSAAVSLAELRRPAPLLTPLQVALLDVLLLSVLVRGCGSADCPPTFLFPLAVVPLLLELPTLPGLLAVGGVIVGAVLPVVTLEGWSWAPGEVQLLGFHTALLLGIAVPVAMLARYLRGREEEMERQRFLASRLHQLNELMKAAAGAELDLDRAARAVAAVARDAVGGDAGIVALRPDGADGQPDLWAAAYGQPPDSMDGIDPALAVPLDGTPELVNDASTGGYRTAFEATGLRSWVATPLTHGGTTVGAVLVGSRLPNSYRGPAQDWLAIIAQQAALPLANARRHQAERAHTARAVALERTKSDFLLTASHELRTPLLALRLAAGLLEEEQPDAPDSRAQSLLQSLGRNTERLERLVDELLDIARLQNGALVLRSESVDVATVVRDAMAAALPLISAAGQRILVETRETCRVTADRRRLDQVFANLLINAQKYSPAGTLIRASVQPCDGGVLVRVNDEAPGIPAEERERIFEAFYRLTGSDGAGPGGLGLGLAIAKGIVELHGGRIWVERSQARGNTFAVFLPFGGGSNEVGSHVRLDY